MRRLGSLLPSRSWMGVIAPQEFAKLDHAPLAISQNFVVPEADDLVTFSLNISRPSCIDLRVVLAAIYLDHQFQAMTCEIGDVMAEGDLKPETGVREEFLEQSSHSQFGIGRIATQLPGAEDGNRRWMFLHRRRV